MLTLRELPHLHQLASMLPGHSSSSFPSIPSVSSVLAREPAAAAEEKQLEEENAAEEAAANSRSQREGQKDKCSQSSR